VQKKRSDPSIWAESSIYLGSNILNAAIPFALLPILTRFLEPAEYGTLAVFQIIVGALSAFVGVTVAGAANRKYYDDKQSTEIRDFIGTCLQLIIISSIGVLSLLWVVRTDLSAWLQLEESLVLSAVLVAAGTAVVNIRLGQWQVRHMPFRYGLMQVTRTMLGFGVSILLVVVFLWGAEGRILAQIIASSLFALISIWLLARDGLMAFAPWRPDYFREIAAFSIPLIPHVGGAYLLASMDRIVISSELGLEETGLYMAALQISLGLKILFEAINKAYVPWLFERLGWNSEDEKRRIVKNTYLWFFAILALGGGGFLIGPKIVPWIVGSEFAGASNVIGWLILGQAFGGMYLMVTNYIFYSKRTGMLSLASIFSGALNVILLLLLIEPLGLQGAAVAFAAAMCVRFIFTWFVANRSFPMPWFHKR
jgi:O-antigen/teichoic acid export membrane protein